ncbi:hypothetical protein Poli38472_002633 [Pythium oligandrum]|uniref:AMP-dependent synthetase/ligase domain-containing protein n=1 Tax=Pythium oligandrum TaxID=41045 RepID=A0A8K1FLC1_PYTOL|nr:hypothetical protein Poli38472_002633 [Pythium oligandrum]|eukprot:TMW63692.1 hypothetical protein Poli38472_002633 [Pythium oligandrum]
MANARLRSQRSVARRGPTASTSGAATATATATATSHSSSKPPPAESNQLSLASSSAAGFHQRTASNGFVRGPNIPTGSHPLHERKGSFGVGSWSRGDPMLVLAEDVLHKPTTVWLAFKQLVFRMDEQIALTGKPSTRHAQPHDQEHYTWSEYHQQAVGLAKVLVHLGFAIGDGAVFCAKSSPQMYFLNMAVIAAGGMVAHVRQTWHSRELLGDIFPNARAKLLIVDSMTDNFLRAVRQAGSHNLRAVIVLGNNHSADRVLHWDLPVTVLTMDEMNSIALEAPDISLDMITGTMIPSDCCAISFGYDEDGHVRGACLSHDNLMFTAANLATSFGPLSSVDRLVGYLPLYHVASQVLEIYMPLLCGISVFCGPSYNEPLNKVILAQRPTIFFATPDTWAHISLQVYRVKSEANAALYRWAKARATNNSKKLRYGQSTHRRSLGYLLAKRLVLDGLKKKIGLESCHACYSVLAPLDFELEKLFKTIDIPIYQLYGNGETSGFATINFPHAWEFGSSGRALKGTAMIYDEQGQQVLHRGRHIFMGYMKHGHIQAPPRDGWYRIGQRGHLTPDGFLKIIDPPRQFVVLSTGDWVPIEPFERTLTAQLELERAVLVGDGRVFLAVLLFMKTTESPGAHHRGHKPAHQISNMSAQGSSGGVLSEEALRVGRSMGSHASTVLDVIKCQRWAVHFDQMLEELPSRVGLSGFQVRKWIIMASRFTVQGGELEAETGEVKRRVVDGKYQALLDSLYS